MKFEVKTEGYAQPPEYSLASPEAFQALDKETQCNVLVNYLTHESARVLREAEDENNPLKHLYAKNISRWFASPYWLEVAQEAKPDQDMFDGTKTLSDFYDFENDQVQKELREEMDRTLAAGYETLSDVSVCDGETVFRMSGQGAVTIVAKKMEGDRVTFSHLETGNACTSRAATVLQARGEDTIRMTTQSQEALRSELDPKGVGGVITFNESEHDPEVYILYALAGGFSSVPVNTMSGTMLQRYMHDRKNE